ncbi:hypothetical protein ACT4X9_00185 [Acinetobacter baumannii]
MKPEQFIRVHGIKRAKECIPSYEKHYCGLEKLFVEDLKRLVESLEIIETVGYDRDGAEEIYEFSKDCEVIHYAGLEIKVTRLAQAIRDHESIYGGE